MTAQPTAAARPRLAKRGPYKPRTRKRCLGCNQIHQSQGDYCAACKEARAEADKLKEFVVASVCGVCGNPLPKYAGRHKRARLCTRCMPPHSAGAPACDVCPHILRCKPLVDMRGPALCEWPDRHDLLYLAGRVAEGTAPITVLNITGVDREAVLWALEKYGIEA
jgi:hypothetical protein